MHSLSASSPLSITLQDDSSEQGFSGLGCVDECISVFDESTPLLPSGDQDVVESQVFKPAKMTPIPKLQLATLCLVRLLEPIGFTQLFPYINEMVIKLNILDDPSKVGFVSGLVVSNDLPSLLSIHVSSDHRQESVFAACQLMSVYHWAKISDVIGRRPVILVGAIGMGLMTFLFGFSRSLTHMLVTRSIHGFFAGRWSFGLFRSCWEMT